MSNLAYKLSTIPVILITINYIQRTTAAQVIFLWTSNDYHDIISLFHLFTISLFHHFTITPFHLFTISLFHYFTISPFHYFTISPFRHFTISPFHYFTISEIKSDFVLPVVLIQLQGDLLDTSTPNLAQIKFEDFTVSWTKYDIVIY